VKTSQFSFDLPEDLIAQEPLSDREAARLMVLDRATGATRDATVARLADFIEPGAVVVLNDTRVLKARLFGRRESGGLVEVVLLERLGPCLWSVLAGRARRLRTGGRVLFDAGLSARVEQSDGDSRILRFEPELTDEWLEAHGHVPLPPYIKRADTAEDGEQYQTVYARVPGSAAAPTAGLHFTPRLLEELRGRGATLAWVTLHVGLGTFLPIRSDDIENHVMHEEAYSIPALTKAAVDAALGAGRPVLAVGTTVVRTLESAWDGKGLREGDGRTRIYITPEHRFKVVSQLFTNFHTPRSSLLVLVSAFAGRQTILDAYTEAVRKRYRFFSYGDAMLIQ
jgi:S-adenosylmethionine:tRNA ribosyltransferase-isomerase